MQTKTGARAAPWATLGIAILIGLPLFFETGLVLLLPIVVAAAEAMNAPDGEARDAAKLRLIMPALAGLGVVHALVPPHPGPLLAVEALGANLGRTMLYGILVAIPTAIPELPLTSRLGNADGSTFGSVRRSSKFGAKSTVFLSMSPSISIAARVSFASV